MRETTPGRRPTRAADAGLSLVEVLVAVVLLGIGGVATMAALGGAIGGSSVHETKVVGLSVVETAAAALDTQQEDCAAYQQVARDAIPADGWAPGGLGSPADLTVTADCSDPDLHWVTLRYEAPNGRGPTVLTIAVGGPTVVPPPPSEGDEIVPIVGDTTCRITSVTADPPSMTWWANPLAEGDGLSAQLDQDVTITATRTGNCANVRAVLEPVAGEGVLTLPLNVVGDDPNLVRAVINGRETGSRWSPGQVVTQFEHEMTEGNWSLMQGGETFSMFVVDECVVTDGAPAPTAVVLDADGRADADVTVTASAVGHCDAVSLEVDTGAEIAAVDTTWVDGVLTATLAGAPDGPVWVAGTRTVTLTIPRAGGGTEVIAEHELEVSAYVEDEEETP